MEVVSRTIGVHPLNELEEVLLEMIEYQASLVLFIKEVAA